MPDEPNWEPEIRYPKKGDTLLKETGGKQGRLLFADWMVGKFSWYADGFKLAGDKVVDQITGEASDDQLINPVIFLYRHFVELKLKEIILELDSLGGTEVPKTTFMHHDLMNLWAYLKNHLSCIRAPIVNKEIIPSLDSLLAELHKLDPDSFHFRYAVDTNFQPVNVPRCLSIAHFQEMMDVINHGLNYLQCGIEIELDTRREEAQFMPDNYTSFE